MEMKADKEKEDRETQRVSKWRIFLGGKNTDTRTEEEKSRDNIAHLTEAWRKNNGKCVLMLKRSTYPIKNSEGEVIGLREEVYKTK